METTKLTTLHYVITYLYQSSSNITQHVQRYNTFISPSGVTYPAYVFAEALPYVSGRKAKCVIIISPPCGWFGLTGSII